MGLGIRIDLRIITCPARSVDKPVGGDHADAAPLVFSLSITP
jgi:hypothetical protein